MTPRTHLVNTSSSRPAFGWPAVWSAGGLLLLACLWAGLAQAQAPRALPAGERPNDQRLQPPKDLDGYFPFHPAPTRDAWHRRAEQVRRQMQVALGLWPQPSKTPLNPVIHGRMDRGNYTVEKVYFESLPGFFVTGNLYRPKDKSGPMPGVLCPHGHWENGRFMDYGPDRVRREIVQGAERFAEGGRNVLQARCVQLARMGCVVFHYDMLGYADSQQIPSAIAHGFSKQRPDMNSQEGWGLFSPQAEAHLQSVMGLQTWNSVRALDFLAGLPDVDPARIAVTGASGGGTQTFILCALDPRPAVAFPAVMVSTAMQGGCTCENASLLRIDTGNVEFAALFAPKPLGLTAANDWTREMASKGFPELKRHYEMMGAPDHVMLKALLHFDHNYNYVSRAAMYSWMNKHLQLGWPEPVVEEDYPRLSGEELSVWDDQHPRPEGGPAFERELLQWLTADADKRLRQASQSIDDFRALANPALDVILGRNLATAGKVLLDVKRTTDRGTYQEIIGLLRNATYDEELPVILLQPKSQKDHTVLWASESGKAGLFAQAEQGQPRPEIEKLLRAGATVVGVDLLFQGEFLTNGTSLTRTRRVKNPREAAAYTFGYNRALFAQRVHDLLSVVSYLRQERKPRWLDLVGLDGSGPLVAAARAQAGPAVRCAAVNTGGFRFLRVPEIHHPDFLPGGARYGDLPGMLALGAPGALWVAGEGETLPGVVREMYDKAGAAQRLAASSEGPTAVPNAAVTWLLSVNE